MDNSKWASVFGHVGVRKKKKKRETTCSRLSAVCQHVKEAVWTGFDTYGTDLQPAVFRDINSSSVREADLHFVVTERERFSAEERLSHGKTREGAGGCRDRRERIIFEAACHLNM